MKDTQILLRRQRTLRLAHELPEVTVDDGDHVGFSVRKRRFAWYLDNHHGDGIVAVTCKAASGVNESLVAAEPDRFFIPAYTGPRGWVGLRLDLDDIDWDEADELFTDAYRLAAPKSLLAKLYDSHA